MARHRKIDVRMWGDAKFAALSAPQPCGQFLWLYLLSGPHTTSLPGLYVAGEAALSEALGWPLKDFRKAFLEVSQAGMAKADWKARVVWIPKAIRYNEPENPNVVLSWRSLWDEVPECELKVNAYQHFRHYFYQREAFTQAFLKAFGKGDNNEPRLPLANQEQEQEQEQEQRRPPLPPRGGDWQPSAETGSSPELKTPSGPEPPALAPPKESDFLTAWNAVDGFTHAKLLTKDRLRHFKARASELDWVASWREALGRASGLPFCLGRNDRGWRATVDWFLRPGTVAKILEGAYDALGSPRQNGSATRADAFEATLYDHLGRDGR